MERRAFLAVPDPKHQGCVDHSRSILGGTDNRCEECRAAEQSRQSELGIALRMIRHFDADAEREDSLRRGVDEIRAWRLFHMPCGPTKH